MSASVIDIVVAYVQRGEGVPEDGKTGRASQREGSLNRLMLLPCANPACKKGGFLLRREIEEALEDRRPSVKLEVPCSGYTGSLRTEKGGPSGTCGNTLEAEVAITYPPER